MTISQNLLCSTPSYPKTRTVHSSRRVGFSEGNLLHIQMWGSEREGREGECIRFPMRREKGGGVEGHPQRPRQCGSVGKGAGGGVSSFPKPITALVSSLSLSLQVSTSIFLYFIHHILAGSITHLQVFRDHCGDDAEEVT